MANLHANEDFYNQALGEEHPDARKYIAFPYQNFIQGQYLGKDGETALPNKQPSKGQFVSQDPRRQFLPNQVSQYLVQDQGSQQYMQNPTLLKKVKDTINAKAPPAQHAAASAQPVNDTEVPQRSPEKVNNLQLPTATDIMRIDTGNFDDTLANDFPLSTSSNSESLQRESPGAKAKRERPRSHTPRPSNSFILYRREKHIEIMAQYKGVKTLNNNVISKIVANMWRSETAEVKAHFTALADAEKRAHMLKYPDYKYRPRKSVTKKQAPRPKKEVKAQPQLMHDQGQFGNASMVAAGFMMNQQQMPYMSHMMQNGHYPQMQMIDQSRLQMMGTDDRGYEIMGQDRFVLSPTYEGHSEFMPQDNLLAPSDYTHAWPMGPPNGVWDLGLEQKSFEGIPE